MFGKLINGLLIWRYVATFPKPLKITLGSFEFFRKFSIFSAQGAPPVSTTPAENFATGTTGVVDTGGKFATGVNDIGGKFASGVNDSSGK
jgi:hypothetical protein